MKRVAIIGVVLALSCMGLAQTPATQNPPAGQQTAPSTGPAIPPVGKRPPQAKTNPEFAAFNAAAPLCDFSKISATAAATTDPAARQKATDDALTTCEKAADDFAAKYPDSELRVLMYKGVMRAYQSANNADKMMEMGRKVLKIDPDDPEALVGVAEVLAERTRDSDIDKDQRLDEAQKLAQHAIETVETDISVPAGTPQDRIEAFKGFVRSSAYSIIGTLQFNKDKFADAEGSFRKSIDAFPSQPDPVVVLRLALSLDKQDKYPEALTYAGQAAGLTQENTPAGNIARKECDRVAQLAKMPKPAACGTGAAPSPGAPK